MNIGKILNSLDDKLGFWLFKNNNIFSYNLFSYFYEKNIINHHSDLIEIYQKRGFFKGPKINHSLIEQLNVQIKNQEIKKNSENFFLFKWNKDLKEILNKIIFKELEETIIKLQKYYNSKIILTHARIQRNYGYEKKNLEEKFSDNFHNDRWLSTYFKIFINLEDIGHDKGPTFIIPRNKKKEFIKISKYKNRKNYNETDFKDTYINVGKIGETLIFNPSICIHKAGNPLTNKSRDMLMLQFSAIPSEKQAKFNLQDLDFTIEDNMLGDYDELSYIYCKPYGFYKTFKLYQKFKKNLVRSK
tara:strand:- start:971 stop:1873 length:903 start_codon:yes stop_codon:yes gene_type:complete